MTAIPPRFFKISKRQLAGWTAAGLAFAIVGNLATDLLKAGTGWLLVSILNILSFGIDSIRQSAYAQISRHPIGNVSFVDSFFIWINCGTIAFLLALLYLQLSGIGIQVETLRPSKPEKLASDMKFLSFIQRSMTAFFLISFIGTFFGFGQWLHASYVHRATSHFDQCVAIVAPDLSEADTKKVRSDFARIQDRDDYHRVIDTLDFIAKSHGKTLPKFSVW